MEQAVIEALESSSDLNGETHEHHHHHHKHHHHATITQKDAKEKGGDSKERQKETDQPSTEDESDVLGQSESRTQAKIPDYRYRLLRLFLMISLGDVSALLLQCEQREAATEQSGQGAG